jgi:hypothetical protein
LLPFQRAHEIAVVLLFYLLIKWLSDYRKCTISYLECKFRGVKKEQGYLNGYLEPIVNLNRHKDRYLFYFTAGLLIVLNIIGRSLQK